VHRVGPYEVTGQLGRGGMGVVLRARGPDGRTVALKLLHKTGSDTALARFERERRLLAALGRDAGFVPLLDAGDSPHGPWIAMELLAGGTLRDRIDRGALSPDDAVALVLGLARAMARAHARGIVHRDLKPENVLFDEQGRAFVSDLGLAKHWRHDVTGASLSVALSKDGQILGTARYMAPEQSAAASEAGPAADVFALGALLYECLTGEPAFDGETATEIFARAAAGSYEPLRARVPEAPPWLEAVVKKALAPDVRARFPDAAALAAALEARAAGGERSPRRGALIASLALLAAAAATLAVLHARSAASPTPGPREPPSAPGASPTPRGPSLPDWFEKTPLAERPPVPLPRGLRFGERAGEYVNEKDGSVLVWVAPGTSLMGAADGESTERPVHEVRLTGFWIGEYELRVDQFARFVAERGYETIAERDGRGTIDESASATRMPRADATWRTPHGDGVAALGSHPVTQVARADALAYCEWAGLELPTEAQWEKAAAWDPRERHARRYSWGDSVPGAGSPRVGNVRDESAQRLWPARNPPDWFPGYDDGFPTVAPVGCQPAGASAYGAQDMTGNVSEWCRDAFSADFYSRRTDEDPECVFDEKSEFGVERGEEWLANPMAARCAHRNGMIPIACYEATGFRVALSLKRAIKR
jgi:formylglycine-generating enzyme required for sulfatase activity